MLEGYIYDLNEIETIDLTKSYWLPSTVESLTVADRLFLASGMFTFDPISNSDFVVFNNDLIKELELDSPYDLVRSGSWTYEVFLDMILASEKDLDGDGVIGYKDRHGGFSGKDLLNEMWQAPLCQKNSDNTYTYSPYSDSGILGYSRYKSKIDKISYAFEEYDYNGSPWNFEYSDNLIYESFREGRALFMAKEYVGSGDGGSENNLINLLTDNAGVAPYPVVDEEYDYYAEMRSTAGLLAVPSGVADPEMTGRILDYLAYASEKMLYDEYFDRCLKNEENGKNNVDMFELILDSTVYDWANLFIPDEYVSVREKTLVSGNFPSVSKQYLQVVQEIIDETVEKIRTVSYNEISTDEEDVIFGYANKSLFMQSSGNMTDVAKKDGYVREYLSGITTPGEIYTLSELNAVLTSDVPRLLAVSFMAFSEDGKSIVPADELREALIGDKKYTVPDFAESDEYDIENGYEIVVYMTANEFAKLTPPENMRVVANLTPFPKHSSSISHLLTQIDKDDEVIAYLYYNHFDDEIIGTVTDDWEIFKQKVKDYYDPSVPEECIDVREDGTQMQSLKKLASTVHEYTDGYDLIIVPELCRVQMRIDESTLNKLDNFFQKEYELVAKEAED